MTDIFISYSHKDELWKDRLQAPLRALQLHNDFEVWDDRQIELGANWLPAIENAIAKAKVAVLLVSTDFLISDFVLRQEIPKFLQRREQEGLRVVPIIVRPCPWEGMPWLAALQGATKDNKPLAYLTTEHEVEDALSQVALSIYRLLQEAKAEASQAQAEAERLQQERLQREAEDERQAELRAKQAAEAAEREEAQRLQREREAQEKVAAAAKARAEQAEREAKAQQAAAAKTEQERIQREQAEAERLRKREEKRQRQDEGSGKGWLWGVGVVAVAGGVWWWVNGGSGNTVPLALSSMLTQTDTGVKPSATARLLFEPEMVRIPAGSFEMGCKVGRDDVEGGCYDDEKPLRPVQVGAFQLAKTEVTFAQYDARTAAGVCPRADDEGWGRGQRPLINVSWNDAQKYIGWLNQQTGKRYRLPSEAEWEYAARGGRNDTAYPWGNNASRDYANYGKKDQWVYTAPVGGFAANGFGLHDMHGNVWEWVQDCYENSYEGAPGNGIAVESSDCKARVLRGGSWSDVPGYLRSASRFRINPTYRINDVGFRLARTL